MRPSGQKGCGRLLTNESRSEAAVQRTRTLKVRLVVPPGIGVDARMRPHPGATGEVSSPTAWREIEAQRSSDSRRRQTCLEGGASFCTALDRSSLTKRLSVQLGIVRERVTA